MNIKIYQVDAFTTEVFKGNPAAVCPLDKWLSDEMMQQIAAENNLSETAFFVSKGDDFQIRWFTPAAEVNLCGHATLASAHVLWKHEAYSGAQIVFHSKSGPLTVFKENDLYTLNFPVDQLKQTIVPDCVLQGLQIEPLEAFTGREDILIVLGNQAAVEGLTPDFRLLNEGAGRGVIVTAPGDEVDFVSRCFYPRYGIDEDPVTGSAHTTLTAFWAEKLLKNKFTALQLSQRGGQLWCKYLGSRVEISGNAVTYLIGMIKVK